MLFFGQWSQKEDSNCVWIRVLLNLSRFQFLSKATMEKLFYFHYFIFPFLHMFIPSFFLFLFLAYVLSKHVYDALETNSSSTVALCFRLWIPLHFSYARIRKSGKRAIFIFFSSSFQYFLNHSDFFWLQERVKWTHQRMNVPFFYRAMHSFIA